MSELNFEQEGVYSKSVVEFVTVAHEFCKLLEQNANLSKSEFIGNAQKLLPLLYLKTSLINIDEPNGEIVEKFVTELDWQILQEGVAAKLGSHNSFVEILRNDVLSTEDTESVSLAECFADIYQDLKDFTTLYHIGSIEAIYEGLCECIQSFQQYWGQRLLTSLCSIHSVIYGAETLEDEGFQNKNTDINSDSWFLSD